MAFVYTCVLVILAFSANSEGLLIAKPVNYVATEGSLSTLPCATDSGLPVKWTRHGLDNTTCVVFDGQEIGACADKSRYIVSPAQYGIYNLSINNTESKDAGAYSCEETSAGAQYTSAVYGVIDAGPALSQSPPPECVFLNDKMQLTCSVTYHGSLMVPLVLSWSLNLPESNITISDDGRLFTLSANITASTAEIPTYTCFLTFDPPTGNTVPPGAPPGGEYAQNPPAYMDNATTTAYSVQKCPHDIHVTLADGSVVDGEDISGKTSVYCNVSGGTSNIMTTYLWTEGGNDDVPVSNTSSTEICTSGRGFSVTCSASSSLCTSRPCSETLSKTVQGTCVTSMCSRATISWLSVLSIIMVGCTIQRLNILH